LEGKFVSFVDRVLNLFRKSEGVTPIRMSPDEESAYHKKDHEVLLQQRRNSVLDAKKRLTQQSNTFVLNDAEDTVGQAWVVVMRSKSGDPPSIGSDFRLELIDPQVYHPNHPFIEAKLEATHIYIDDINSSFR